MPRLPPYFDPLNQNCFARVGQMQTFSSKSPFLGLCKPKIGLTSPYRSLNNDALSKFKHHFLKKIKTLTRLNSLIINTNQKILML